MVEQGTNDCQEQSQNQLESLETHQVPNRSCRLQETKEQLRKTN